MSRPDNHPAYDFDPIDHAWLLLQDGRERYKSENSDYQKRKRRAGGIFVTNEVQLIDLLKNDWLCGEAKLRAIEMGEGDSSERRP